MSKTQRNAEHAFIRIERDLKNGRIPGIVLLCGKENYLTAHYANTLLDRCLEPASRQMDLTVLEGAEVTPERIEAAGEIVSLLSPFRVIYLPDFINGRGNLPAGFMENEGWFGKLTEYMKQLPEGVLLLITASKPISTGDYKNQSDGRRLKKLQTAVKDAGGAVYDFGPLDEPQLLGFIGKRLRSAGKECDPGVLRRIIRDSGYGSRYTEYDLYMLENDLAKLIASCGERDRITEQDAAAVLTESPEINVFRMIDAVAKNRRDQALISLNTLIESGESEFGILSILTGQLELMLIAGELLEEGAGRRGAADYLCKKEKVSTYRAKNVAETASRFSVTQLRFMLSCALEIEEQIKSGLMEPRLALEFFVARI